MGEENVVSNEIKFTEEELTSIKAVQVEYQNKVSQFGQLKLEILLANKRMDDLYKLEEELQTQFNAIQEQEKQLVTTLNSKYGAGTLNPQTGVFVPSA